LDFDLSLNFIGSISLATSSTKELFTVLSWPGNRVDFRGKAPGRRIFIRSPLGIAVIKKALHDFPDY
jgi:hypothetical protein